MTAQDIIERLERATGPDRELDIAILKATDANGYLIEDDGTILVECDMGEGPGWFNIGYEVPTFTASIDAALTLIEEGWEYSISTLYGIANVELPLNDTRIDPIIVRRRDGNVVLAFVTAALKARASISSKELVGS